MIQLQEIFGQESAIESILRAYRADRLPHGMIFAGPTGVGKATTARALAGLFLCERPAGERACGACAACTLLEAGNHPDYHVITKELIRYHDRTGKSKGINLSIDVIRPELIEPANLKPGMGRGKVFVVEQAGLMTPQAQNAMLKTLEEPAGRTLIILLTDRPDSLLPTVRSRCQMVRFAALEAERVQRELVRRGYDQDLAADAARLAGGSLGRAIKWIDQGVIDAARDLSAQMRGALSGRPPKDLPGWFRQAADAYAEKQLELDALSSKDQATREGLALYLLIASQVFRQSLLETADGDDLEDRCAAIDALARAESYLDSNVSIPLVLQQLAVTFEK